MKSQVHFSSKGRSAEGSVGLHPGLIHQPIHYADKEEGLSSAYLLKGIISISVIRCANSWP